MPSIDWTTRWPWICGCIAGVGIVWMAPLPPVLIIND